jgi:hypothetical protein
MTVRATKLHGRKVAALVEASASLVAGPMLPRRRCGEGFLVIKPAEAVMEAVQRIDEFLKKARTSWMTPFMGGAFAGVFLFWV